jgi:serine/threonine protein kinase/tetratricopeptide (TPR) repeat protein
MSLPPGTPLGPYRIAAPLGAGGMGEVYRARDERLGRDVAIKVLPTEVSGDPDRLARFEREARALAALSHPNILAIFDFGKERLSLRGAAGPDAIPSQEITYAVTELLEGETLRERLRQERLPWRKGVEIAAAIADGLAAAHGKGIIHRDLKPDNVFVTSDGRVKILDFGLARLAVSPLAEAQTFTSPPPGTLVGAVLGTVGYMAPEQVRGEPADARSDIFALGCVLYEMLSGERAFKRDTAAETMTAILREPAPEVSVSGIAATPELNRIVGHSLEKQPAERFQSASDVAFALRSLSTGGTTTVAVPPRRFPRRALIGAAAAILVIVAVTTLLLWKPWRTEQSPPTLDQDRVVVAVFENRTGDRNLDTLGVMTADVLTQGLSRTGTISVALNPTVGLGAGTLPGPAVTAGAGSPIESLARQTRAGLVVAGAYYLEGQTVRFEPRLVRADGRLLAGLEPVAGPRDAPTKLVETLGQRVLGAVASFLGRTGDPSVMRAPSWEAYREFERAMELFGSDFPETARRLQRVVAIEPSWYLPRYLLFLAFVHQSLWAEAAQQVDAATLREADLTPFERLMLRSARAQLAGRYEEVLTTELEMERQAPELHWTILNTGAFGLRTNRPRYAIQQMRRITDSVLFTGNPEMASWPLRSIVWSHHNLGEFEEELEAARRGRQQFPTARTFVVSELRALAALGRLEEVDRLVEEALAAQPPRAIPGEILLTVALELRAHGHREASLRMVGRAIEMVKALLADQPGKTVARQALAERLYTAERWDEAQAVTAELAKEKADDIWVMGMLGTLAARRGDPMTALSIAERLKRLDQPYLFGEHTYWRACIAAQLGEKDDAVPLLRQSVAEGLPTWMGLNLALHTDIDLEPLLGYPPYEELLKPKG